MRDIVGCCQGLLLTRVLTRGRGCCHFINLGNDQMTNGTQNKLSTHEGNGQSSPSKLTTTPSPCHWLFIQKRARHHHHGLVMSLIPGGGNLESVCGYELACGESHSKFFNVIVITFTNKVNAQKPIITAFAHKRCF